MKDSIHMIVQRIDMVTHLLGRLAVTEGNQTIEQAIQQLHLIGSSVRTAADIETSSDSALMNQVMADLARCKLKLSTVSHELDELKSQAAERYREELGEEKQHFETLSLTLQQQMNAEAYRHKTVFEDLRECLRENDHLMSDLMDLKSSIEHERFERLGIPTGDGAIITRTEDHGDTPYMSP